jgi:hypothetical protein
LGIPPIETTLNIFLKNSLSPTHPIYFLETKKKEEMPSLKCKPNLRIHLFDLFTIRNLIRKNPFINYNITKTTMQILPRK